MAYYSKQLSPAEKNYTITELECLAVVRVIDHFAIHLLGHDFTLVTDHHALAALRSSGKLNECLLRWALSLQLYSFKVKFRPGKGHSNADGLEGDRLTRNDNGLKRGDVEVHPPHASSAEPTHNTLEPLRLKHITHYQLIMYLY